MIIAYNSIEQKFHVAACEAVLRSGRLKILRHSDIRKDIAPTSGRYDGSASKTKNFDDFLNIRKDIKADGQHKTAFPERHAYSCRLSLSHAFP